MSGSWKRKTAATEMERIGVIRDSSDTDSKTGALKSYQRILAPGTKQRFLGEKGLSRFEAETRVIAKPVAAQWIREKAGNSPKPKMEFFPKPQNRPQKPAY